MALAEIAVWIVDVDDDAALHHSVNYLPETERVRLGARAQPHRRRAQGAHAALRILASLATTGVLPLPELAANRQGKPVIGGDDLERAHRLQVSLSHAGAYAAIALGTVGPLGVDIEDTDPLPDRERFGRAIMAESEWRDWQTVPLPARDTALMQVFTRKEAVLKALGTGLAGDVQQVATQLSAAPQGRVRIRRLPADAGGSDGWTVVDLNTPQGWCGAVAVQAPAVTVREHRSTITELLRMAPRTGPPPVSAPRSRRASAHHPNRATTPRRGDLSMSSVPPVLAPDDLDQHTGLQVFCLPHAGGNSVHFRGWTWLAPYARVVPVDLPGHGSRLTEPLMTDWERLVGNLTDHIAARVDGPYVLFGHSFGSLLAFDIAHRLTARGLPPALLVAAGRNGPSAKPAYRPIHHLPDAQFLSALDRLGGMPEGILSQPELLQMFLPVLRADLRLAERFTRPAVPALPLPVLAFAGEQDPMTDDLGMLAWKQETSRSCELVFLPGGHFFLEQAEFAGALTERIARLVHPVVVG